LFKHDEIDQGLSFDPDYGRMPKGCALFRVDAGPDIGLGHLQRCLSLATALRHLNMPCLFLTNKEQSVMEWVTGIGFECSTLTAIESWGTEDLEQTLEAAGNKGCSAVVVDSDHEGADYLSELRSVGYFVVAIEDNMPHLFPCHLVVNGDAHARELVYESPFSDTQFLLGPQYSILRHEFWEVPSLRVRKKVENLLVTLGGSDPYNIMPKILHSLDRLPGTFGVSAIIGPFFDNLVEIETASQHAQRKITVFKAPDSVHDIMVQADLAISAGGQTLYELARVGCPTVAIRIAANQDGQLRMFEKAGFLKIGGHASDAASVEAIGRLVVSLLGDPETRAAMSAAGQHLIDGQGALRVAHAILEGLNRCDNRGLAIF